MLSLARESRGYSQTELARRMGVTQGYISKLEAGLIEVPEEKLAQLAAALDYPLAFFGQYRRFGDSPCLYHRKRQTVRVTDLRRIEAECVVAALVVSNITRGLSIDEELTFPRMDADEYGGPESVAQILRRYWSLPQGPVRDMVLVLEAAGGVVIRQTFGTTKVDAVSQWPRNDRPLFAVNAEIPWDRARYTLAHELGHLVMHTAPSSEMEEEADRFAAEFLMPAEDIAGDLHGLTVAKLAPLKQYWRVSMAALVKRARDLDLISQRQYRSFFMHLGRMGYRRKEPWPLAPEEPTVLADAIHVHRQSGLGDEELAHMAKLTTHEMRTRFCGSVPLRIVEA